jgi:uncharacterized protein with GYD domain
MKASKGGTSMETFFMFGKYTSEAIRDMSIERTQQAVSEIKKLGGEVQAMHALLGEYDLLFCVKLPSVEDAIKASAGINKLTGISFTTCPAITVETFDQLMSEK